MPMTRSKSRSKKAIYRSRVKSSHCRGLSFTKCRRRDGCKRTHKGTRKSYCRKLTNRSA